MINAHSHGTATRSATHIFILDHSATNLLRVFARRVALWRALSRGDLPGTARSSARARVADLSLTVGELKAAHFARSRLGRAIREARARAAYGRDPLSPALPVRVPPRGSSRSFLFAVLIGVSLAVIAWLASSGGQAGVAGQAPSGAALAPSTRNFAFSEASRGRTVSVPLPVAAEPLPTSTPVLRLEPPQISGSVNSGAAPPVTAGTGSGGAGGPGAGGGGKGVTEPSSIPPTSAVVPSGYVRFHGRVVDAFTGRGIPGMCLVIGSLDCAADKPHSDANGYWSVDLTMQPYWGCQLYRQCLGVPHGPDPGVLVWTHGCARTRYSRSPQLNFRLDSAPIVSDRALGKRCGRVRGGDTRSTTTKAAVPGPEPGLERPWVTEATRSRRSSRPSTRIPIPFPDRRFRGGF